MTDRTIKATLAAALIRRFPGAPTAALARMLCAEYPLEFPKVEGARWHLRYARGACGDAHRQWRSGPRASAPPIIRSRADIEAAICHRLGLPVPEPADFTPISLPPEVKRWLILADIQVPFHDPPALDAVLTWAKKDARKNGRFDGLLLNGDIQDCYQLSSFIRDPKYRDFDAETTDCMRLISVFRRELKPKRIIWKAGNHENRLNNYLCSHAPELKNVANLTFPGLLELEKHGITWIDWGRPIRHHNLFILHGDEYPQAPVSPVNPARGVLLKTFGCVLVAHSHRTSEHSEQTIDGTTLTCWSMGCLCSLTPVYRPIQRWNHGFTVLNTRGDWSLSNHRIIKGAVK